jgi:hypothetical protein
MTITISLPDELDIENYTGLKTFLTDHLELPDAVVAQLPTLIRLAEVRLNRLLSDDAKETSGTVLTVAGTQSVSLPTDLEALQQVRLNGTAGYPLAQVSIDQLEDFDRAGKPIMFAMHSGDLQLAPAPDAVYTLFIRYRAKLAFLNDNAASNWLLANHSDAYVYMASAVICQHVGDQENARLYLAMAEAVVFEINQYSLNRKFGGNLSPRMVAVP